MNKEIEDSVYILSTRENSDPPRGYSRFVYLHAMLTAGSEGIPLMMGVGNYTYITIYLARPKLQLLTTGRTLNYKVHLKVLAGCSRRA